MTTDRIGAVLITGCSSGIGHALAEEWASRNKGPVVATARDPKSIEDLRDKGCLTLALDVTDMRSIDEAIHTVRQQYDAISMLVNNAGWGLMGPISELDLDKLNRQLMTNVVGPVAMIKAVVPHMAERRAGVIVNVGSVSGVLASPFAGAYCASKAAVHALTDSLRIELRPFGISVVSLQPGAVLSRFGHSAAAQTCRPESPQSLYAPFEKQIRDRAQISQQGGMQAADFAARVVDDLLRDPPPAVIRHAPLSRKLPLLARLPIGIRDRILAKKFGLASQRKRQRSRQ